MAIEVRCQNGHVIKVHHRFAGKAGLCPECRAIIEVPVSNHASVATARRAAQESRLCVKCRRVAADVGSVCTRCSGPLSIYRYLGLKVERDQILANLWERRVVDDLTIDAIAGELHTLVDDAQQRDLVLDLSGVVVLSSAMLGKLLALQIRLEARGGEVQLRNVGQRIREVLAITKLDHMFHIEGQSSNGAIAFARDRRIVPHGHV
jgi:anti-anti-sigma factor